MMNSKSILMIAMLGVSSFAVSQEQSVLTFSTGFESIRLIRVEGGVFQMGSEKIEDAQPVHEVAVSLFYMAETEVTNAIWADVYGDAGFDANEVDENGFRLVDDDAAKGRMTYVKAADFVDRLNDLLARKLPSGCSFSIPTEAQWEYAARGGVNNDAYVYSGSQTAEDVAVFGGSTERPGPIKTKSPNSLGIYDMSGNVAEWCTDYYTYGYDAQPTGYLKRVQRGGHVGSRNAEELEVADRAGAAESACMWYYGLRLVLNIPENTTPNPTPETPTSTQQVTVGEVCAPRLTQSGGRLFVLFPDGRKVDLLGREI